MGETTSIQQSWTADGTEVFSGSMPICDTAQYGPPDESYEDACARANLIAAAPDMLKAFRVSSAWLRGEAWALDLVRPFESLEGYMQAVIAQAT